MNNIGYNLFGEPIEKNKELKDKFIVPPFSILDSKTGSWQNKKRAWKKLGIESEKGRDSSCINMGTKNESKNSTEYVSIFDPVLTEIIYHWFCPEGGKILDPFAGGSVRGIVSNFKGYDYTGLELREEQVKANIKQGIEIVPENVPKWYCGDSEILLDTLSQKYDFVFSCPPYFDLEKYSDDKNDLSNMNWDSFKSKYCSIIKKSIERLNDGGLACFVVGEVRDKKGNYINLVGETIQAFIDGGAEYYNEIILLNTIASASMRAEKQMDVSKKVAKIHQNVLVFKK